MRGTGDGERLALGGGAVVTSVADTSREPVRPPAVRRPLVVAVAVVSARAIGGHLVRNAPAYLLAWTVMFPLVWLVSFDAARRFRDGPEGSIYRVWQEAIAWFAAEVERVRGEP